MKKQISLLAILLLGLVTTAWAATAFTVEVSIGSADAEPSLVFGQAETAVEKPYPPFSSMFGVKDIYLANPDNLNTPEAGENGDLARLGTDIRELNDDSANNQWMIVANSDAKLYFAKDVTTVKLKIFASDSTADGAEDLGDSYSVKAGVDYTIFAEGSSKTEKATRAVAKSDPVEVTLKYNESQKFYFAESDESTVTGASSFVLTSVGGDGTPVYLFVGDGETTTEFVSLADGARVTEMPSGWILVFHETVTNAEYVPTVGLRILFASNVSKVAVRVRADKGSYKDVSVNVMDYNCENLQVQYALHIQSDGTLDFDQDGNVDMNDATFFYNYVSVGGADIIDEIIPYASTQLTDDLTRDAQNALDYFKGMNDNLQALSLVEADTINGISDLSDSATFFYNNESIGGADLPAEITPYTSRKNNTEQDLKDAQEALDRINELKK